MTLVDTFTQSYANLNLDTYRYNPFIIVISLNYLYITSFRPRYPKRVDDNALHVN